MTCLGQSPALTAISASRSIRPSMFGLLSPSITKVRTKCLLNLCVLGRPGRSPTRQWIPRPTGCEQGGPARRAKLENVNVTDKIPVHPVSDTNTRVSIALVCREKEPRKSPSRRPVTRSSPHSHQHFFARRHLRHRISILHLQMHQPRPLKRSDMLIAVQAWLFLMSWG